MSDFSSYLITFCRFTIAFAFIISFVTKVQHIAAFAQTMAHFQLLPAGLNQLAARLFLGAELVVMIMLLRGGTWLSWGFGLAIGLLIIFSGALASVLVRNIQTACYCFGSHEKMVSLYDVWRNGGLLMWAVVGIGLLQITDGQGIGWWEQGLLMLMALLFLAIWIHLADIIELFRTTWDA